MRRPTYDAMLGVGAALLLVGCTPEARGETASSDDDAAERSHEEAPGRGGSTGEGASDPAEEGGHGRGGHGHGGHDGPPRHVELSAAQLERLDLRVGRAEAGDPSALLERPATVRFDPDRIAKVGPRVRAKVVRVETDLGARVEQGEVVAVLSSVELGRERSELIAARARLETRRKSYERQQSLRDREITSEASVLEAKSRFREARAEVEAIRETLRLMGLSREAIAETRPGRDEPLSRFRLRSPLAGVVEARELSPGDTLGPRDTPIHVVDSSAVWVVLDAYERDLPRLASGQRVELTTRALPGERFTGVVDWIARRLDEDSRTVRVRARVDNPEGLLRAGMYGRAAVHTGEEQRVALVPVGAVQKVGDREVVFVPADADAASGDGEAADGRRFRIVPVRTGDESAGHVAIRAGLSPGDRVVVAGAFELKATATAAGRSASH